MLSTLMDNCTNIVFHLLPFSPNTNIKLLIVCVFSIIYLMGTILNSVVIVVICRDAHLHTPMYIFFSNLSVIDIFCSTLVVPKLLHIVFSGNDLVSFIQCFTQMYFFFMVSIFEVLLLFVMGCDRYVAICLPLHYHRILSMRNAILITVIIWVCAFINSSFYLSPLLNLTYDRVVSLHQFFCDFLSVFNASYGDYTKFYIVLCIEWVLFGLCPFFCNLVSYVKIFCVIAHIKSREGRRKTFSTCSPHLIVMMIYYSTAASHVMSTFYHTGVFLNQFMAMFYTIIVPTMNPLVYSLRNNEIKKALQRLVNVK